MNLTKEEYNILDHTKQRCAGGFYCGTSLEMINLVTKGLMKKEGTKAFVPDPYFSITKKGEEALREFGGSDER